MTDDYTTIEKLKMLWKQFDPRQLRGGLADSTHDWEELGPMDFFVTGKPEYTMYNILIAVGGSFSIIIFFCWQAYLTGDLRISQRDMSNWNLAATIIGFGVVFLILVEMTQLHFNTWGQYFCQIEPCVITNLHTGKPTPTALRIVEHRQVWPPKGTLKDHIEKVHLEEILKENKELKELYHTLATEGADRDMKREIRQRIWEEHGPVYRQFPELMEE